MSSDIKTLTVRVPSRLYRAAATTARKRQMSINSLLVESLEASQSSPGARGLYDAFTKLGSVAEACDVEYAIHAQQEVARRNG